MRVAGARLPIPSPYREKADDRQPSGASLRLRRELARHAGCGPGEKRDDLPPPHEHLPRKRTLLSTAVKHERVSIRHPRTCGYPYRGPDASPQQNCSLDHLVGAGEERGRDRKAQGFGRSKLMSSSNFVGLSVGRSAGFAPLKIFPQKSRLLSIVGRRQALWSSRMSDDLQVTPLHEAEFG